MSDGPYRVTVAAPGPPAIVEVSTEGASGRVEVLVPGVPGPSAYAIWQAQGHLGSEADFLSALVSQVPGPPGPPGDYGRVSFTERVIEPSDTFVPGVSAPILFAPDPGLSEDDLRAPFAGHVFWHDSRVIARALGDVYDLYVNLILRAQQVGGYVTVAADVGSSLGPVIADAKPIPFGAGIADRMTFTLPQVKAKANFVANGCRLLLTATVPLVIVSETVIVAPRSAGGGP